MQETYHSSKTFLTTGNLYTDHMDTLPDPPEGDFTEWLDKGLVSNVKNQMYCGGCWAFATASTLTDRVRIATGGAYDPPYGLSEQYLVSCGNKLNMANYAGCDGGMPHEAIASLIGNPLPEDIKVTDNALEYSWYQTAQNPDATCKFGGKTCDCSVIEQLTGGIASAGQAHNYCSHGPNGELYSIDLWPTIPQDIINDNVKRMKKGIYYEGPIVVGIQCFPDFSTFRATPDNYYESTNTTNDYEGHAIVIVGWKKVNGVDCWIVKNSWGTDWGYAYGKYPGGFINMVMGKNNCFIESNATAPHPEFSPLQSKFPYLPTGKWHYTTTIRDIYLGQAAPPPPINTSSAAGNDYFFWVIVGIVAIGLIGIIGWLVYRYSQSSATSVPDYLAEARKYNVF